MRSSTKTLLVGALALTSFLSTAQPAKSIKHAERSTELRQSLFSLLGSNMGPLGAMAKGKIPLDAKAAEKHALRINQLSMMIADYTKTDTSGFDVKTEALAKIWKNQDDYAQKIKDLSLASSKLQEVAAGGDKGAIKKAIGGVGRTCGGCHDEYKKD